MHVKVCPNLQSGIMSDCFDRTGLQVRSVALLFVGNEVTTIGKANSGQIDERREPANCEKTIRVQIMSKMALVEGK